jgi:hypothetical protein
VLGRRQRFEFARRDVARHCFLALLEGEPAGTGWAAVREHGVILNGGAVDPRFLFSMTAATDSIMKCFTPATSNTGW